MITTPKPPRYHGTAHWQMIQERHERHEATRKALESPALVKDGDRLW